MVKLRLGRMTHVTATAMAPSMYRTCDIASCGKRLGRSRPTTDHAFKLAMACLFELRHRLERVSWDSVKRDTWHGWGIEPELGGLALCDRRFGRLSGRRSVAAPCPWTSLCPLVGRGLAGAIRGAFHASMRRGSWSETLRRRSDSLGHFRAALARLDHELAHSHPRACLRLQ